MASYSEHYYGKLLLSKDFATAIYLQTIWNSKSVSVAWYVHSDERLCPRTENVCLRISVRCHFNLNYREI